MDVSKHDELDTYLPAFRAAVIEGKAGSVMCAYNSINGQPACANEFLLQDQLRGKWGFPGLCRLRLRRGPRHLRGPPLPATPCPKLPRSRSSARHGQRMCRLRSSNLNDHDYKPISRPCKQGYLPESAMDTALMRLFTARIKLGMFDPAGDGSVRQNRREGTQ